MKPAETAKTFLRNRWALRRNQPWTPIHCFGLHLNEDLPDVCRLSPTTSAAGTAEAHAHPSAVSHATRQE